jgi:hypothetical protein
VTPAAGWYDDPWHAGALRWWDGTTWTGYTVLPQPARDAKKTLPPGAGRWIIGGLVGSFVVAFVLGGIVRVIVGRPGSAPATLAAYIGLYGTFAWVLSSVSTRLGTGSWKADFGLSFRPSDIGWGPLVWVGGLLAAGVALAPIAGNSHFRGTTSSNLHAHRHDVAGFIVLALVAIVAAPIFEELFFRGLLLRTLTAKMPITAAVLLQAAVFASLHLSPFIGAANVGIALVIGALGTVLGIAATRFQRLGPGMVAHALQNTAAVIALLVRQ